MQIEDITPDCDSYNGVAHYFSAVLFEGWQFWTAGPAGHIRDHVISDLLQYQNVERAVIARVYVPRIN